MMTDRKLDQILARYQNSFIEKVYAEENEEHDILMNVFGIYSNPKSFVNFLLPPLIQKEGWGGVKKLQILQGLLYLYASNSSPAVEN